jgi:protein gp37
MGKATSIGWTDHTFNPWWGCVRVSPGCEHCYAETFAKRVGQQVWGPAKTTPRRTFGDHHWAEPERWNADAKEVGRPARVFCASMADVFEDHHELPPHRARLFELIERTPYLDWQLLTKRPENVMGMVPRSWRGAFPENVWLGTSVEDQQRADERVPVLTSIPARIRFLSCEPLIGPVDLRPWASLARADMVRNIAEANALRAFANAEAWALHWVIVGGESGPGARPMDSSWARDLVAVCDEAGIAAFVKQLGAAHAPARSDAKAEEIEHFPAELRIRQFPGFRRPVPMEART